MAESTSQDDMTCLRVLQALVQDHGDAFRWSISQKGRIWLTLTHWDGEKYNTSVELDGIANVSDMLSALSVLCVAHRAKCFGSASHSDTWTDTAKTKSLQSDAMDVLRTTVADGSVKST